MFLNEWVAEGVAFDPSDFSRYDYTQKVAINSTPVSLAYGNSDKSICV